jgi:hypothetical protein
MNKRALIYAILLCWISTGVVALIFSLLFSATNAGNTTQQVSMLVCGVAAKNENGTLTLLCAPDGTVSVNPK